MKAAMRRLRHTEAALSPKQQVLNWLHQALKFGSEERYFQWLRQGEAASQPTLPAPTEPVASASTSAQVAVREAAGAHHGPARCANRTHCHVPGGTQASARRHAATRGLTIRMSAQSFTAAVAVRPHHEILLPKSPRSPSLHASSRRIGRKT
jgi:hypothetical protein